MEISTTKTIENPLEGKHTTRNQIIIVDSTIESGTKKII
jgi:hypothetical protein